jgi:hypothetical protein
LDPALAEGLKGIEELSNLHLINHLHRVEPGPSVVTPFVLDELKSVFACHFSNSTRLVDHQAVSPKARDMTVLRACYPLERSRGEDHGPLSGRVSGS